VKINHKTRGRVDDLFDLVGPLMLKALPLLTQKLKGAVKVFFCESFVGLHRRGIAEKEFELKRGIFFFEVLTVVLDHLNAGPLVSVGSSNN
jgi:hypothetical protein